MPVCKALLSLSLVENNYNCVTLLLGLSRDKARQVLIIGVVLGVLLLIAIIIIAILILVIVLVKPKPKEDYPEVSIIS